MEKIINPDMGKSQIMPAVTVRISMPQGAAVPGQAGSQPRTSQGASQAASQAPQQTAPSHGD
jgi:hypothetical protein